MDEPGQRDNRLAAAASRGVRVILILIVAAAVAGCGNIVIGPVDHSCPANPSYSMGSGCSDRFG